LNSAVSTRFQAFLPPLRPYLVANANAGNMIDKPVMLPPTQDSPRAISSDVFLKFDHGTSEDSAHSTI
jgi:hypothetical protein